MKQEVVLISELWSRFLFLSLDIFKILKMVISRARDGRSYNYDLKVYLVLSL